jgi:uncharacterized SAM-binding protein YcdF (DUF218 family)
MKRHLVWGSVALVLFTAVIVFAFLQAGRLLGLPAQEPEKADLIVALGGDNGGRVHKVAILFKEGFAPLVLLTGMEGGYAKTRNDYLNWRARFLEEHGIPKSDLIFDDVSGSSWEEAINTLHLMRIRDFHRVLVVSDPPHLRRLDWVWRKVFAGSGKEYRLISSDMEGWDAAHWWRNENAAQFVVMEYVKLGYYLVVH